MKRLIVVFGLLCCLLVGILVLVTNAGRAGADAPVVQPSDSADMSNGDGIGSDPNLCEFAWRYVNDTSNGAADRRLFDIVARAPDDIWAVGSYYNGNVFATLTEHWNGSAWAIVPSPVTDVGNNELYSVTAVSSNDVWAVGYSTSSAYVVHTLIEHWNGTNWGIVVSPGSSVDPNELQGVTAVSSTNVWAVGYQEDDPGTKHTLIEHWNGANWAVVNSPNVGTKDNVLNSAAAVSGNDVWAVGSYRLADYTKRTLVLHWTGSSWNTVSSPSPGAGSVELVNVSPGATDDVWAVGYQTDGNGQNTSLTEHWNGASWQYIPSPNINDGIVLTDVVAWSSINAWAIGGYTDVHDKSISLHWDGTSWTIVHTLNKVSDFLTLNAVSMVASNDVWAGGFYLDGTDAKTLFERYSLACVTATPTIEPSATPTGTPTTCAIQYTDVPQGSTFYDYIRCLACRGIISGYSSGCASGNPCFRPNNNVTRGQLAKIVSNAAGYFEFIHSDAQTFKDVPVSNTFWVFVERVALHSVIGGYIGDGATVNPCTGQVEQNGQHYFRPCNNATRGQIAKIDAVAMGYADLIPPGQQTFLDVPSSNTFWLYVERVVLHGVVSGYAGNDNTFNSCIGQVEQTGHQYFRPCNNTTRGQIAKIIGNTFFPNCQTPNGVKK